MSEKSEQIPPAEQPKARSSVYLERQWMASHGYALDLRFDVLLKRMWGYWDDSKEARDCLLDWKEQRTEEARAFKRWEELKRKLRAAETEETQRAEQAAMDDPVLEYRILAEEKAQRDAAVQAANPSPYTRIRALQAQAEARGERIARERYEKQSRAWRRDYSGPDR
jgi:hypothetical protein